MIFGKDACDAICMNHTPHILLMHCANKKHKRRPSATALTHTKKHHRASLRGSLSLFLPTYTPPHTHTQSRVLCGSENFLQFCPLRACAAPRRKTFVTLAGLFSLVNSALLFPVSTRSLFFLGNIKKGGWFWFKKAETKTKYQQWRVFFPQLHARAPMTRAAHASSSTRAK
jgi:hypothetical protein